MNPLKPDNTEPLRELGKQNSFASSTLLGWVDIKKQLPNKEEEVIITDGKIIRILELQESILDGTLYWTDYNTPMWDFEDVTHWMPLPKQPNRQI